MTYRTFKRSATNFSQFFRARKYKDRTGLSLEEARARCQQFNDSRTPAQIKAGTKLEFEREGR